MLKLFGEAFDCLSTDNVSNAEKEEKVATKLYDWIDKDKKGHLNFNDIIHFLQKYLLYCRYSVKNNKNDKHYDIAGTTFYKNPIPMFDGLTQMLGSNDCNSIVIPVLESFHIFIDNSTNTQQIKLPKQHFITHLKSALFSSLDSCFIFICFHSVYRPRTIAPFFKKKGEKRKQNKPKQNKTKQINRNRDGRRKLQKCIV